MSTSNCSTISVCSKSYGYGVQKEERSSADYAQFKSGNAHYNYIRGAYIVQNLTPKFKSNTDYVAWKRMNAQLNSDTRTQPTLTRHT